MESRLIVGLGNPGSQYAFTRHNLGFLVGEHLARALNVKFKKSSLIKGMTAKTILDGVPVYLLLPLTYMNKSGEAVKKMAKDLALDASQILVVTDDLSIDFGQLRIRPKGTDGGHNGLKSIVHALQTENFARLRMGIGHPGVKGTVVDFVLEEFTKTEKKSLDSLVEQAGDCCLVWLKDGIKKAMDQFNRRKE